MATGAAVNNYNDTVNTGREFKDMGEVQSVVDTGLESDKATAAYKYAQNLQEKQNKGKDLSDWNVGRQYQKNVKAVDAENSLIDSLSKNTGIPINTENDLPGRNGQYTPPTESSATAETGDTVRNSPNEYDKDGNRYWHVDTQKDIFKGIKKTSDLKKTAYNYILNGADGMQVSGTIDNKTVVFNRVGAEEYVYGRQSQELDSKYGEQAKRQKMRLAPSIDDLIENASVSWTAPDSKNHKQFAGYFDNYRGRVKIDNTMFNYIVRVGYGKSGDKLFYDLNLEPIQKEDAGSRGLRQESIPHKNIPTSSFNSSYNDGTANNTVNGSPSITAVSKGAAPQTLLAAVSEENSPTTPINNIISNSEGNVNSARKRFIPRGRIDISSNSEMSIPATAGHEFLHAMKVNAPEAYQAIENYVLQAAYETNSESLTSRVNKLRSKYGYSKDVAREEIVAEIMEKFPGKKSSIDDIIQNNPTLADKILSGIKSAKAAVQDKLQAPYRNRTGLELTYQQLNKSEKLWNEGLRQIAKSDSAAESDGTVRNSPKENAGNSYVSFSGNMDGTDDIFAKLGDNAEDIMQADGIFEVDTSSMPSGKNISDSIYKYFVSVGGKAVSPKLGTVELTRAGAKSTTFHGIGRDKLGAVGAIKDVIEKGEVIDHQSNWKNRGYDTYIIAGHGTLDGNESIVGVVVKNYPKSNINNKFYLHEVIKTGDISDALSSNSATPVTDRAVETDNKRNISPTDSISDSEGNVKYSVKENTAADLSSGECQERFAENVDKVFSGEMPQRTVINIGDTPELLQKYGASDVPITINQSVMYKIAYPTGYFGAEKQGHNLGIPALKQLPKQIADPAAILKSTSQDNSLVLLTEWEDTKGNPVIIPLQLDKDGIIGISNEISSAYGKQNIDALLKDRDGNSTILYTKNNEGIHQTLQTRLQLPGVVSDDTLVNNSIHNSEENVKYSVKENTAADLSSEECQERFAENVDKVFSGEMPQRTVINIGDTPELLQKYGASDVPITINQSVMYKIAYPTGYFGAEKQGHNLGIPALKQLPKQIADPAAILKSTSQDKSMILLTEWKDTHGNPVIIPLHLDKDGSIGVVNDVASAYGKQNFDTLLTDNEGNSTVLYTKNNEDIHRLTQSGLQLPGASTDDTLVNNSIRQNEGNVKYSVKENTDEAEISAETQEKLIYGDGKSSPCI